MLPPREEITWSRKLKKKSRERASKGMRHESAAQVCTTHIWRSPRKLRKNDSQEKCFCQSYNCAVAKVWRIVCESNCIDEPAGENCHTEVTSQIFAPRLGLSLSRQTAPLGVELVSDCSIASMHLDTILPCFHCVCTAGISRVLSLKTLWSSNGFCVY